MKKKKKEDGIDFSIPGDDNLLCSNSILYYTHVVGKYNRY